MTADRTQNESALVCAAREGDKRALETLMVRHWAWLKALVYGVLADAHDLDDVMQNVCLRVVTRIHTLRQPECFRAWLAISKIPSKSIFWEKVSELGSWSSLGRLLTCASSLFAN